VYLDPNPFEVQDPDNPTQKISGVTIEGINETVKFPQLRPLDTNNIHAMVTSLQNYIRTRLGSVDVGASIGKCLLTPDPSIQLMTLFDRECKLMFDVKMVAQDMPVRGILSVYVPYLFLQLVNLSGGQDAPIACLEGKDAMLASVRVYALQALRLGLQNTENNFSRIYKQYDASLPHDTFDDRPQAFRANANKHSLFSDRLRDLLANSSLNGKPPAEQYKMIASAEAHLNLHYHYHVQVLTHAMQNYMFKHVMGVSLSSAAPGQPCDILIGGH
jgi:hypothetical protein